MSREGCIFGCLLSKFRPWRIFTHSFRHRRGGDIDVKNRFLFHMHFTISRLVAHGGQAAVDMVGSWKEFGKTENSSLVSTHRMFFFFGDSNCNTRVNG